MQRRILLAILAIVLAFLIVVALTFPTSTNSASTITLTGFSPYSNSGAQLAYQMGILQSGVNVGEVAVAAGTVSDSTTPVSISLYFMSNTSLGFEIDCVSFSISQVDARPVIGSVQPVGEPQINLLPVQNQTASASVLSFCHAQYVNKEGWAEYDCYLTPNGTSTFVVSVVLTMTRETTQFTRNNSVSLTGLNFTS